MTIMRFDPTGEFISLREAVDKLFQDSFIRPFDGYTPTFSADLYETPETFVLTAALPGVKPELITIEAMPEAVTVKAELKEATEVKEEQYLRKERKYGKFLRTFTLPLTIDPNKVEATFEHGIVRVVLPKTEVMKPKQIKVKATM
jgi:HSP20 family protein